MRRMPKVRRLLFYSKGAHREQTDNFTLIYEEFYIEGQYRVSHFIFLYFEQQLFHLRKNFLMFKIRFHILQTLKFYDISSFFDLSLALFHKLVFFKNNFLYQKFFLKIFERFFFALNSFLG